MPSSSQSETGVFISPGMVTRIRRMFESEESENKRKEAEYLKRPNFHKLPNPKPVKSVSSQSDHALHKNKVKKEMLNKLQSSTLKTKKTLRSTTVETNVLLELLRHYRTLCKSTNQNEHFLCSELLEAEEPFIGMLLDEPDSLSISGDALQQVRNKKGNRVCADCGIKDNSWASSNIGVFICIQCSGIHRSLGVHITSVLSCSLDIWSYNLIEFMSSKGNIQINDEYEYFLSKSSINYTYKLKPNASREERNLFIKAKYVTKDFHKKFAVDPELTKYKANYKKLQFESKQKTDNILNIDYNNPLHSYVPLQAKGFSEASIRDKAMVQYCGIVFISLQNGLHFLRRKRNNSLITQIYIAFSLGNQYIKSKKRKNINKPKWNEALQLNLPVHDNLNSTDLTVSVIGQSAITGNIQELGTCVINIRDPRYLEVPPQKLQLSIGDGTLNLTILVTDLNM